MHPVSSVLITSATARSVVSSQVVLLSTLSMKYRSIPNVKSALL